MRLAIAHRSFVRHGMALLVLLAPHVASAALFGWFLQGVTFDDGGTATGWLVWDSTTGFATRWAIAVSGGTESIFPPLLYTQRDSITGNRLSGAIVFSYLQGTPDNRFVVMDPSTALDGPGPIPLDLANANDNIECFNCGPYRFITAGSLVAPEPSGTAAAATVGLIAIAAVRRRVLARRRLGRELASHCAVLDLRYSISESRRNTPM